MYKNFGVVGHPLTQSLAPALFKAAFAHFEMDEEFKLFDFDPIDPETLANFCYETDLNQIGGFTVESPYRETVMMYMDHYDPLAKIVGAVNTVINTNSTLIGHYTESLGALQALLEKTHLPSKRALVLGTGAKGRGLAYSLKEFGAEVFVFDRELEAAEALADEFDITAIEHRDIEAEQFDILINATPVGAFPERSASILTQDQIPSHAVVMDLVSNPIRTKLLEEAEQVGAQIISGERTLLHSAMLQFELWFKRELPLEVMEEALYEALEKNAGLPRAPRIKKWPF